MMNHNITLTYSANVELSEDLVLERESLMKQLNILKLVFMRLYIK